MHRGALRCYSVNPPVSGRRAPDHLSFPVFQWSPSARSLAGSLSPAAMSALSSAPPAASASSSGAVAHAPASKPTLAQHATSSHQVRTANESERRRIVGLALCVGWLTFISLCCSLFRRCSTGTASVWPHRSCSRRWAERAWRLCSDRVSWTSWTNSCRNRRSRLGDTLEQAEPETGWRDEGAEGEALGSDSP